jgi:hypothetical protein
LRKRCEAGLSIRIVFGIGHEDANAPHTLGLLRANCKRPRDY